MVSRGRQKEVSRRGKNREIKCEFSKKIHVVAYKYKKPKHLNRIFGGS